jgi:hypothetical protein
MPETRQAMEGVAHQLDTQCGLPTIMTLAQRAGPFAYLAENSWRTIGIGEAYGVLWRRHV